MSTIGARLKQLRAQYKLNQEQVGEKCGVTKGMVSQWEKDIVVPPIERMLLLRKTLHFKLDWLYCGDGDYRPEIEALYAIAQRLPAYAVQKLESEATSYVDLIRMATSDKTTGKHKTQ